MAQYRARAVTLNQCIQLGLLVGQSLYKSLVGQLRHILLRVINPGRQVGVQRLQGGLYFANALSQSAIQRGFCQRGPLPPIGRDNLHHRFGLRQRHTAVFQRTAGKFSRPGRGTARVNQRFQQAVRHGGAAMYRQLNHILAGVGVRRTEK